jgi:two-component system, OmpR family, phosphate regulon sensor histidine kinase PhoR
VQQIALTHGGRVQARNHPDGGAVIELVLPKGV